MPRILPCLAAACSWFVAASASLIAAEPVPLNKGDKIVVIGNTTAERLQYFNNFETLLHARFPEKELVFRNLGFSGDTIDVRLRSQDFPDHGHTLIDHQPQVIFAFFGFNESFAGPNGVAAFETNLAKFLADLKQLKYPVQNYPRGSSKPNVQDKQGEVKQTPRIVLFSPIANEDLTSHKVPAATLNNKNIELYTAAMKKVADQAQVTFIDLYTPTKALLDDPKTELTINGCHLSEEGDAAFAKVLDKALFGEGKAIDPALAASVKKEVAEKNKQFFYDYRAVNGFYIYGGRKKPFGVVNFPGEFAKLRKMIEVRDHRVWEAAQGKQLPEKIDDSKTGDLLTIETNFTKEVKIIPPEESQKLFTVADGFEVSLYASEVQFPELQNPVSFTFDAAGRIWVTTNASYPQYLPGEPVDDKILILSDTNNDGKADKQQIFAEGLYLPIGIELADGGAYVSQQPNMMFLKDTNGDEKADIYKHVLHGLDTGDSHHAVHAFEWGPGGELYFSEGTFHHSQIESPYGLTRSANAAVYRYDPKSEKFSNYVAYEFANPWGHVFDQWGQNFVADASGGNNYVAAPFSGSVDFPRKHPGMKDFLVKQWRPTCGCELVSSRNFPEEMQGDFLLNNCIGFQGVLQYRIREEGSGYFADPVAPLLRSADPNFRPVDLQFGPDGALYVLDWYNPLVGHMQHSIRDPNRSKIHGRIWKISNTKKPLNDPPSIAGQPIQRLLYLLTAYEDRTRYRVRRELRDRDPKKVLAAVDQWLGGIEKSDPKLEHHQLEAFWVKQQHNVLDEALLKQLLTAKDGHVRAAAVRAVSYAKDRLPEPLAILQTAINDEHPRVRLEAIRALSFYDNQAALDVSVEALLHEQDDYLEYAFKETQETLQRRVDAQTKAAPAVSGK
ncbi:PVC-type heme-binding CxxCH protein [Planctomicrobium piriforme]|uniref:Putative membrane-bound dehydrogenase domain-containing protein n=1 Tax=Planctomicrobium piriforme TaxID=1576369 RepID=A0A1I3LCD7_9PLAN|nr:PVC-type heme-binding CxxCH protein [Planctomicrobium piriforme]SFI82156.1 putative membrane-bound dehydrogenase domain-containing protein [Planctomicrobium piriforme]